jgi:hypothetical protein
MKGGKFLLIFLEKSQVAVQPGAGEIFQWKPALVPSVGWILK